MKDVVVALATCSTLPSWEVDDRPLVEALRARGVQVDVLPWDMPADWSEYTACLLRTTWDYCDRLEEFLSWVRRVGTETRLWNPPALVEWNARKSYLRDLELRGAPVIPTEWLDPSSEGGRLAEVLRRRGWQRAFLKPEVGASARLTMPFEESPDGLARAEELLRLNPGERWLVQPFLASVLEEGEVSAIFIDGELTHGVRKTPVPGDYRVQDDFGARDECWDPSPEERELCERIVAQVPTPWLYARVDLLRDDSGALLLTELEAIEPSMFFRHAPEAAEKLASALLRKIAG